MFGSSVTVTETIGNLIKKISVLVIESKIKVSDNIGWGRSLIETGNKLFGFYFEIHINDNIMTVFHWRVG